MSKQTVEAKEQKTILPAESNPKRVEELDPYLVRKELGYNLGNVRVELSETVIKALNISHMGILIERGEVESVVEVDGKKIVLGNDEVILPFGYLRARADLD